MKCAVSACILLVLTGAVAAAESAEDEKAAIIAASLDYMDGALSGDASRMARAIHQEVTKNTLTTFEETGRVALRRSGSTRLVELVRAGVVTVDEEQRRNEVTVFDSRQGLASVKVVSSRFYDYLHLATIDGQWKIVNALWIPNQQQLQKPDGPVDEAGKPGSTDDGRAIRAAALDYIEGWFTGDPVRMERALHPELTKVSLRRLSQTGNVLLHKLGSGFMVEATRAQRGLLAEEKRQIELFLYDVKENIASVGVMCSRFYDYLHLAKIDGQWKIVTALWTMNPGAEKG
jgi:hypothetical protein